jgi:hypothetical protein
LHKSQWQRRLWFVELCGIYQPEGLGPK